MRNILKRKLHDYLVVNYPDILIPLQQEAGVTRFLEERIASLDSLPDLLLAEGKPAYIVEELCLASLTRDLGPSRFNYLCSILQEEFETVYYGWLDTGILPYEGMNLIQQCSSAFSELGFGEDNEENEGLRLAIVEAVRGYLDTE
jgi:hypothetical protein